MFNEALFDDSGRCIPDQLEAAVHVKTRRQFSLVQPKLDFGAIHQRLAAALDAHGSISPEDFQARAETILRGIAADPATASLAEGVRVPFFLPKTPDIRTGDMGDKIQNIWIKAVGQTFTSTFPKYSFTDHNAKAGLSGKLAVQPGSRHDALLDAMSRDAVVGWFFPALREYSLPACLEQLQKLPEKFLLAGGVDLSAALIACPDLLHRRDGYPPLLWMAALSGEKPNVAYHYEAYGYNLTFNRRVHFDQAAEYWAAGLTVLG